MKYMTNYLLSLDKQYDKQTAGLRNYIYHAQEAEIYARKLHVQFTKA
jgi:hypothetical protein